MESGRILTILCFIVVTLFATTSCSTVESVGTMNANQQGEPLGSATTPSHDAPGGPSVPLEPGPVEDLQVAEPVSKDEPGGQLFEYSFSGTPSMRSLTESAHPGECDRNSGEIFAIAFTNAVQNRSGSADDADVPNDSELLQFLSDDLPSMQREDIESFLGPWGPNVGATPGSLAYLRSTGLDSNRMRVQIVANFTFSPELKSWGSMNLSLVCDGTDWIVSEMGRYPGFLRKSKSDRFWADKMDYGRGWRTYGVSER